jgi:hypothetical protein
MARAVAVRAAVALVALVPASVLADQLAFLLVAAAAVTALTTLAVALALDRDG